MKAAQHDCYSCKFRGTVPGSAHSSCKVLRALNTNQNADIFHLEVTLASHNARLQIESADGSIENLVQLNPHGVKRGWADWPLDFDPVWVEHCYLYANNNTSTTAVSEKEANDGGAEGIGDIQG